jgi:cytochrome c6
VPYVVSKKLDGGTIVDRMRGFWFALAVCAISGTFILNCPFARAEGSPGAAIFKSKCELCHGADGTGNTTLGKQLQAANLRSKDVQKKTNAELHKAIHDGNGNMPPFADQLNDSEINQVLQFVRSLGKAAKK